MLEARRNITAHVEIEREEVKSLGSVGSSFIDATKIKYDGCTLAKVFKVSQSNQKFIILILAITNFLSTYNKLC